MIIEMLSSVNSFLASFESQPIENTSFSYVKAGATLALTFAGIAIFEIFRRNHFQFPDLGISSLFQRKPVQQSACLLQKEFQKHPKDLMFKDFLVACETGDLENVKSYLGANKDKINWDKGSVALFAIKCVPLHYAIKGNQPNVLKYLLSQGANVNAPNGAGNTPLHAAIIKGNLEMVKIILENKPDVTAINSGPYRAIEQAIVLGNVEIVKLLMQHGIDVNSMDNNYTYFHGTPFQLAVEEGQSEIVQLLIDNKANVIHQDLYTAIELEIEKKIDPTEIIKMLLKAGIDKDKRSVVNKETPEEYARRRGAKKALEALQ